MAHETGPGMHARRLFRFEVCAIRVAGHGALNDVANGHARMNLEPPDGVACEPSMGAARRSVRQIHAPLAIDCAGALPIP